MPIRIYDEGTHIRFDTLLELPKATFTFSVDPVNSYWSFSGISNTIEALRSLDYTGFEREDTTLFASTAAMEAYLNTLLANIPTTTATISGAVTVQGVKDDNTTQEISVTPEGHQEVAIHDPILPFGSVHTENLIPIFQADAVYGVSALPTSQTLQTTSGSGTATASDSAFVVTTGTTIGSQGVIQSRKRLRYRAGQGIVGRFTTLFTTPVASSYQLAGFGHAEDGIYVGYVGTDFGLFYTSRGVREVRTLTITTASSTTENVTVTLNGTANSIAVTNSGNIQRTVYELSRGTYTGWDAYPDGATVVFVRKAAGAASGAYSIAGTTVVGSFVQTKAGATENQTLVAQADWNGDKLDGTGASGVTLDKTKLNIWQISLGYLGTDSFVLKCKVVPTNGNNATWIICHTVKNPNSRTQTTFGNPAFPFTIAAYSAGSTTDLTVKCGSFAGFVEGKKMLHGNRFTYLNTITTGNASTIVPLFSVINKRYYAGRTNQAVVNLLSVNAAVKHTQPVIIYLIRNGTLSGNPNFQELAANSCTEWDTAATAVTYSTGDQLVATWNLGETGNIDHHFGNGDYNSEEVTLQPGEMITVAVKSVANNIAYTVATLNTREDQ